jgi:hypothetical protein
MQGEANTKCKGCNEVKSENCWYMILNFFCWKIKFILEA